MSGPVAVPVSLTPAEHAALAAYARRTGRDEPDVLRGAFLMALADGAYVPTASQIRAWLRDRGWVTDHPGPAGALWRQSGTHDPVRDGVGVPHGPGDWRANWGAVERIAQREMRNVADVAMEMLAISEGTVSRG